MGGVGSLSTLARIVSASVPLCMTLSNELVWENECATMVQHDPVMSMELPMP